MMKPQNAVDVIGIQIEHEVGVSNYNLHSSPIWELKNQLRRINQNI